MDTIKQKQQEMDCRWKLSESQRQEIIRRRKGGESQSSIARDYDIHQSTISRVVADYLKLKMKEESMYE